MWPRARTSSQSHGTAAFGDGERDGRGMRARGERSARDRAPWIARCVGPPQRCRRGPADGLKRIDDQLDTPPDAFLTPARGKRPSNPSPGRVVGGRLARGSGVVGAPGLRRCREAEQEHGGARDNAWQSIGSSQQRPDDAAGTEWWTVHTSSRVRRVNFLCPTVYPRQWQGECQPLRILTWLVGCPTCCLLRLRGVDADAAGRPRPGQALEDTGEALPGEDRGHPRAQLTRLIRQRREAGPSRGSHPLSGCSTSSHSRKLAPPAGLEPATR